MKISIVTVVRDGERTIRQTLQSVLGQARLPEEYILVHGASSDSTLAVLEDWAERFAQAGVDYVILPEERAGIYAAMNQGLRHASGDLIGLLNADDFYEPSALQRVADAAQARPDAEIIYGFIRMLVDDDTELVVQRFRYETYLLDPHSGVKGAAQHPACFVRKAVYDRIGVFDESFTTSADYEFLVRAAAAGIEFLAIDGVLVNFRTGGASKTISNTSRLEQRLRAQHKNGLLTERAWRQGRRALFRERMRERLRRLFR